MLQHNTRGWKWLGLWLQGHQYRMSFLAKIKKMSSIHFYKQSHSTLESFLFQTYSHTTFYLEHEAGIGMVYKSGTSLSIVSYSSQEQNTRPILNKYRAIQLQSIVNLFIKKAESLCSKSFSPKIRSRFSSSWKQWSQFLQKTEEIDTRQILQTRSYGHKDQEIWAGLLHTHTDVDSALYGKY